MLSYLHHLYKKTLVHNIERSVRRSTLTLKYLIYKKKVKPIFVIASRRTGSYLLLSYLGSHPEIDSVGEVINPDLVRGIRTKSVSKNEVMFHIKASINNSKSSIGVAKLLAYQMKLHNLDIDDVKNAIPDAKFIILYRESLSRQFISNEMSKASGIWKISDKNKKKWKSSKTTIKVNSKELEDFCKDIKKFYDDLLSKEWVKKEALLLSYEELKGSAKEALEEKLFSFLNLSPVSIKTSLEKMNKRPIEETVTNYDEVKDLLESKMCKLTLTS